MKIWSILLFLLFNIWSSNKNVHCKTPREKSSPQNPITESVKNVSDLPIDPLIVLYLSDHMSSQECFQFYNYLVSSLSQGKMTLNQTWSYKDFTRDPNTKQGKGEFPCFSFLKQWLLQVKSLAKKSELEKRIYAQTFLLVALHKINRNDLHSWMDNALRSAQHDEIKHLENDLLLSHHSALSKKKSKHRHSFEEEEAHSTMIAGFISLLFLVGVTALMVTYIWIAVRFKPRDYIPLNSTDSETDQRKKWGNEASRGYYNFVPLTEV